MVKNVVLIHINCPEGWQKYALMIPHHETAKEFDSDYDDDWGILYHGTFVENAHLILQTCLLFSHFSLFYVFLVS